MTKRLLYILWLAAAVLAAMTLAGCIDDTIAVDEPQLPGDGAPRETNVYFRVSLQLPVDALGSRADSADPTTPATPGERAINTLDLLVFDAETDRIIDIFRLDHETLGDIENGQVVVPMYARVNRPLRIRVAANAPRRMREQMMYDVTSADIKMKADGSDYRSVINAYIPGSNGLQKALDGTSGGYIPMTGTFADADGNTEITIPADMYTTPESALTIHDKLERIVAKMHVVARDFESKVIAGMRYVTAKDPKVSASSAAKAADSNTNVETAPEWLGWIRTSNVLYTPNATNKSTYLFAQSNPTTGDSRLSALRDLNMDLDFYSFSGELAGEESESGNAWDKDYVYYDGVDLQNEIIKPEADRAMSDIESWNQDRIDRTDGTDRTTTAQPYVKGMYCLENYFDRPSLDLTNSFDAIPMVTHLSIAARLTPRRIVVKSDFMKLVDDYFLDANTLDAETFLARYHFNKSEVTDEEKNLWQEIKNNEQYLAQMTEGPLYLNHYRILTLNSEKDAVAILNWSLKGNRLYTNDPADFTHGYYPSGTFYAFKFADDIHNLITPPNDNWQEYLYLTAGAVATASDENIALKIYAVSHIGGWGYYYTYIRGTASTPAADPMPYTSSQVTRNTYYLLTVDNFSSPGGSIFRPEYIKVNTDAIGWDYSGRGDIELK